MTHISRVFHPKNRKVMYNNGSTIFDRGGFMLQLLLIDSHSEYRQTIGNKLKQEGYNVYLTDNAASAYEYLENNHVDLILLDPDLPREDGYGFCRALRENDPKCLVLMLSASLSLQEKKKGFMSGADNYIEKTADYEELLLHIRALLRLAGKVNSSVLVHGHLVLDMKAMTVTYKEREWTPAPKEFQLLYLLLSHTGIIFTRDQLIDELWGPDTESGLRTVNTHIARLRKILRYIPDVAIVSVRGVGYKAVWKP